MGDLPLRTPTHRRLGGPLPRRLANAPHAHPPPVIPLAAPGCPDAASRGIRRNFFRLSPCGGQVAYVLLTRAPVAGRRWQAITPAAPLLACVKPVASVHPEPGSNSSLLYLVSFFLFRIKKKARRVYIVYTFADTHAAPLRNESSSPAVIESPGRTDRDISAAGTGPDGAFSCTTSSLIYCNSFNVLSFRFFLGNALQS